MGWYKLGYFLVDDGQLVDGISATERACALAPTMMPAIINLYIARHRAGRPAARVLDQVPPAMPLVCYRTFGILTAL
jgi:hypothetical protein